MEAKPPVAKRVPTVRRLHGVEVVDDWAWLRNKDDPDTIAYLEAENAYTEAWFAPHKALCDALFEEIRARIKETDLSVPARKGPWWYTTRTQEGAQYPIHCRRPRPDDEAGEQVLLDENVLAEDHAFFELGGFEVSPSHRLLAYSVDVAGNEVFTLRIRDLERGVDLADAIEGTHYGLAWSADDRYVFYTRPDDAWRSYQVWRHEVGTDPSTDVLVLQEDDSHFDLSIGATRSERFIVITAHSRTTTEVRLIDTADPTAPPLLVEPRQPGHEYHVDHQGDRLLITTNWDAIDFRVMEAPLDAPGRANWREVLPHRPGVRVHGVDPFASHVVVLELTEAVTRLRVLFDDGRQEVLDQPEDVYTLGPGANLEYDTTALRYTYQSLVTPPSVFEVDLATGTRTLLKQQEVLGGYDPSRYRSGREWATAPDGTRIPISYVQLEGTPRDGSAPLLLYGYGSYEISMTAWFSWHRLSLLDRGVTFAIAHVRGGGEMGRSWYESGKLLAKRNTFTDFVACAEHLVATGWTSPERLAIRGGSAGGLLVGAATNLRPDLFAAVVAEVPFVDVVNTMLDETLPLTVGEWEEWGNPQDPEYAAYMASYAPYENVRAEPYPAMFVTAGLNDPRVSFHEPAKWVAKLRATTTGTKPILLKTEMRAGHGGASGRYDAWRDEAQVIAFLLVTLGVES